MYLTVTEIDRRGVETRKDSEWVDNKNASSEFAEAIEHARNSAKQPVEFDTYNEIMGWPRHTLEYRDQSSTIIELY